MATLKLIAVQLKQGVHIPGSGSQTIQAKATHSLEFDAQMGLVLIDTGKAEHLIPLTSIDRLDPVSEKYKPKPAPAPAPVASAPAAASTPDVVKFTKDPKTGAIIETRIK